MPEDESLLLPEPFSEKNIDGSPIVKSQEGRSLFRSSSRASDGARPDRRVGERRSGGDRRAPVYEYDLSPGMLSPEEYNAPMEEPAFTSYEAPAQEEPVFTSYEAPVREEPAFTSYEAPVSQEPAFTSYEAPVSEEPDYGSYEAPAFAEPAPSMQDSDSYDDAFAKPEEDPGYDTERFDPPVDEKPGMIPNPLKMPPVKKKSSLDYDLDSDYGDYGDAAEEAPALQEPAQAEDSFGYYGPGGVASEGDYGYYDSREGAGDSQGGSDTDTGSDYGFYEESGGNTETFGDADAGAYGEYSSSSDFDSDYGSDYESGSDVSSDYY